MHRISFLLPLLAAGCVSDGWQTCVECITQTGRLSTFYPDFDQDGWGSDNGTTVEALDAGAAATLLAEELGLPADGVAASLNRRDCLDDPEDPQSVWVTGRIASLCPSGLATTLDGSETYSTALATGGKELIMVHDEPVVDGEATPTAWSSAAAGACGPWGWGGGAMSDTRPLGSLVSFAAQPGQTLDALAEVRPGPITTYVGYVGAVSHLDAIELLPDGWYWEDIVDGAAVYTPLEDTLATLPYCDEAPNPELGGRLALIYDEGWCVGLPSEVGGRYATGEAHFVCSRDVPRASEWIDVPPE